MAIETTLKHLHCCNCGTLFAIDPALLALRKADGQWFHCPNGHRQRFSDTPADKLERVTAERDQWQKEAERLLTELDKARSVPQSRSKWFTHLA